jgi:hypothetical protein
MDEINERRSERSVGAETLTTPAQLTPKCLNYSGAATTKEKLFIHLICVQVALIWWSGRLLNITTMKTPVTTKVSFLSLSLSPPTPRSDADLRLYMHMVNTHYFLSVQLLCA